MIHLFHHTEYSTVEGSIAFQVLECHAFICTNAKAANALVRCCFHAYAESMYVKLDERLPALKAIKEASRSASPPSEPLTRFFIILPFFPANFFRKC